VKFPKISEVDVFIRLKDFRKSFFYWFFLVNSSFKEFFSAGVDG